MDTRGDPRRTGPHRTPPGALQRGARGRGGAAGPRPAPPRSNQTPGRIPAVTHGEPALTGRPPAFFNEALEADGSPRAHYRPILAALGAMGEGGGAGRDSARASVGW